MLGNGVAIPGYILLIQMYKEISSPAFASLTTSLDFMTFAAQSVHLLEHRFTSMLVQASFYIN